MVGGEGLFELQLADQGVALEKTVFLQSALITEDTESCVKVWGRPFHT